MKQLIIYTGVLLLFLSSLQAQSTDSLISKKVVSTKKYSFPFCVTNNSNCIGYTKDEFPGPDPKVSGILIQDSIAIVIDSDNRCLLKISLNDGVVTSRSNTVEKEKHSGGLRELVYFNESILLLSDGSSNFYQVNNDLVIERSIDIPSHGTLCEFYREGPELYIVREKYIWMRGDSIAALSYRINNDLTLTEDTLVVSHNELRVNKRIYGETVKMYEDDKGCFLQTSKYLFEIPEMIPQFNMYLRSVGFNDQYLVYFVLLDTYYEMVVCKYEE